jgi:hypothetical protein
MITMKKKKITMPEVEAMTMKARKMKLEMKQG